MKPFWKSKRLWAGAIALFTSVSFLLTGEKTPQEVVPEISAIVFSLLQVVIGLVSGDPVAFGGKTLYRGKK